MTSVLIIFEMTGSYALILPLMIANMTAYGLAKRWRPVPVYEALLEQDGVHLPHLQRRTHATHALEQLRVASAMTHTPATLPATMTISEAVERVAGQAFSTYPVIDEAGVFIGFITEMRLRRTLAENGDAQLVASILDKDKRQRARIFPDQQLVRAVLLMNNLDVRHLAVVERNDSNALVGILTMSDIVLAQARAALAAGDADISVMPTESKETKATEEQLASAIPK